MKKISPVYVVMLALIAALLLKCGSESEVEKKVEAQDTFITIGSVTARPDATVDVPITLSNSVAIAGVQLSILFDSDDVTFDKPRTTKRCTDMMLMHNVKENELLLMMYNMSGQTIPPGNGSILMLPVKVAQDASGIVNLDLTKALLATQDAQTIPVSSESGKITIRP